MRTGQKSSLRHQKACPLSCAQLLPMSGSASEARPEPSADLSKAPPVASARVSAAGGTPGTFPLPSRAGFRQEVDAAFSACVLCCRGLAAPAASMRKLDCVCCRRVAEIIQSTESRLPTLNVRDELPKPGWSLASVYPRLMEVIYRTIMVVLMAIAAQRVGLGAPMPPFSHTIPCGCVRAGVRRVALPPRSVAAVLLFTITMCLLFVGCGCLLP